MKSAYQKYINSVKYVVKADSLEHANQLFEEIKKGNKLSVKKSSNVNRRKKKANPRNRN